MTTLTIDNCPEELYQQLEQRAVQHGRTLTEEILTSLKQVVYAPKIDVDALLTEVRESRKRTAHYFLTDEELQAAKSEGRL